MSAARTHDTSLRPTAALPRLDVVRSSRTVGLAPSGRLQSCINRSPEILFNRARLLISSAEIKTPACRVHRGRNNQSIGLNYQARAVPFGLFAARVFTSA